MEYEEPKKLFLSHMSHEIRTPLNVIIGMCEIAKYHIDERDKVLECLEKISVAGEHLTDIVDSVLDITRIQQGTDNLKIETFGIDSFVKELYSLLEPLAVKKHIILDINAKDVVNREITADYGNMMRVMLNLATNSIKYTAQGGFVKISINEKECDCDGKTTYKFICKDNGIGMSEEFVRHIYEPFVRAEDMMVKQMKGTGLGMAIVKQTVELLKGSIQINSVLGEGTEVSVEMDVEVSEAINGKEDIVMFRQKKMEEIKDKKIILVAEDEIDNCKVLVTYLNDMGYDTDIAVNGEEVVDMFMESEEGYYKAVFLDIEMPVMNGYQAAIMIRGVNRKDRTLPVIAMTAKAFEDDRKKAVQAGMDGYLTKPLKMGQLENLLNDIL